MKILLLGEYSSLHWTLAQGLKLLGHNVTVASDGDGFKNYQRDIDLARKSSSVKDTVHTLYSVIRNLKNFKGYDIVQIINPCFTQLNINVNQYLYRFLKKNNAKVFLGAFGDDSFWLKACLSDKVFKYSEFFIDEKENNISDNERLKGLWLNSKREELNKEIADSCDGIVACLYEYYAAYKIIPEYVEKLKYIPLPIDTNGIVYQKNIVSGKVKFFIGINKARSEFKGTDIMQKALHDVCRKYNDETEMIVAKSVPYKDYMKMMMDSHVVLDQLYSYSPAMNGLLSLTMGKVLVGGGEPEMYELLNEYINRPIVNVYPSEEDVYKKLEGLILNKSNISAISENGRNFVEEHHDYKKVAQQYLNFWTNKLES